MAKMKTEQVAPKSIKDAGYQYAYNGEGQNARVMYVMERDANFATDPAKETKEELYAGFLLRKHELMGEAVFKVGDNDTLIPLTPEQVKEVKEGQRVFRMDCLIAMSYTGQEFGKMRTADPARHAIIKKFRDDASTYASNTFKEMQAKARAILNGEKPRARAANKDFSETLKETFATLTKKVKTSAGRGDDTANGERLKVAIDAFWKAYKD